MKKTQKIVFSFDDGSRESSDKMIQQGRYPSGHSIRLDDYKEITVRNPETGEERIVVIPKTDSDR